MEESEGLAARRDVLVAFEYGQDHDDWVTPLEEALSGVTVEEALWTPDPKAKGIWQIVLHMAVWNENMVIRMRGDRHARPAEGPWPPLPAVQDETNWAASQQRLRDALAALRAEIAATPPASLLDASSDEWGSPLPDILCRLIHNSYHIGQIVKLRECYGGVRS